MRRPSKLVDYPWVVVRIDCVLCDRRGCYRLARLAARYGPEQSLSGLLADLACDCPWWRTDPRKYEPRCGARFIDLERNLPPPDDPQAPVHRQRQPDRESLRKSRQGTSDLNGESPMLAGFKGRLIRIACDRCGRRESFLAAEVMMNAGNMRMTDLLKRLVPDCPRVNATAIYELCQVHYDVDEA